MKIKVLSWNIWCGTYLDEVIEFLREADADIIALQEACIDDRGNIAEIIAKELGYQFTHAVEMHLPVKFLPNYKSEDPRGILFGNAILTKHQIVESNTIELTHEDKRLVAQANIKINDKVVNVYSVHLKHTHQAQSDLQDKQALNLVELASGGDTIVMGDFNSLPDSDVIQSISRVLRNTEGGVSTPTWSVYRKGCSVCLVDEVKYKLDYIFTSKELKSDSFKVHHSRGSDHLPITAIIEI
jgi:endonuclease/exonuclease/phosphatase family metal-dependent hydrolase